MGRYSLFGRMTWRLRSLGLESSWQDVCLSRSYQGPCTHDRFIEGKHVGPCWPMAWLEGICLAGSCLVTQHSRYCSVKPEESRSDNVCGVGALCLSKSVHF